MDAIWVYLKLKRNDLTIGSTVPCLTITPINLIQISILITKLHTLIYMTDKIYLVIEQIESQRGF